MKKTNSENVVNCIKRRKTNLIKVFGGKCCICGFDKFQEALEFHHVNPEEKEFGICASNAITKSLEAQLEEMKKCVLVCSNCHRGIHQDYYKVPENWKDFYDEEIAKQLKLEKWNAKHNIVKYCQYCGQPFEVKETDDDRKYCGHECAYKSQRKTERPTREELKELIRNKPFTTIAKNYNVSDNAIRKWCKEYNLPSKKSIINNYSTDEWKNT